MNAEKKWLVKSSDSILGPYEFDRVVENIFNGDIHLLDEIKGPFERWRPIKDHSLFAAAIEKLKASTYQRREHTHTMTATVDIGTQTDITNGQTVSVTTDLENTTTDENPNNPQQFPDEMPEHTMVFRPAEAQVPEEPAPAVPQQPQPSRPPQPQQTRTMPQPSRKRFPVAFIFGFLLIVIGGASFLVYEFKQTRLVEQKISAFAQLTDSALENLRMGEYQKALKNFNLAYSISPNEPNLLIAMAPLSVQFEGQFAQVQTNLEQLMAVNKQKDIRMLATNIIGLSYSYRKQYAEALASYNVVLELDNQYLPSILNKTFSLIKLKKFDKAKEIMDQNLKEHSDKPIFHYFYIRTLLEKGLKTKDEFSLKEVISVANQFPQKYIDFRQEVLFMVALAHLQLNSPEEELVAKVRSFLQVDMELTNLHVHNPNIDFQAFNWIDFSHYCKALWAKLPEYDSKVLQGFCSLKIGKSIEAKEIFEKLLAQQNNDGVLQALYASSLLKLNDLSQAKNALGLLNQVDRKQPLVETILRGCLVSGDLNCARAIFSGDHAKLISPLYYHWGKAAIEYSKSRRVAREATVEGINLSKMFAPLLKMKRKFQ